MKEDKILVNGINVTYKIAGEGPAILVLHGWGGSSDSWIRILKILSKQGYTLLVPDLPGFGKTPPPYDPWSVGDYMEFLSRFLEEIKKKEKSFASPFFLLGHSFGGRVSIKFCVKHPENVRKLILLDSAGIKPKHEWQGLKGFLIFFAALIGNALFTPKVMLRFKDGVRNFFYKMIRNRDYAKADGIMKDTVKKVLYEDLLPELPHLEQETLIIWGDKDKMVPLKYAHIFKKNINNSRLEILKDAGHSPHLECPETLAGHIKNFFH
jgi:pimeloyl-ACP methyl ester carboxylesterase